MAFLVITAVSAVLAFQKHDNRWVFNPKQFLLNVPFASLGYLLGGAA